MNAQIELTTKAVANYIPAQRGARTGKQATLQLIRKQKQAIKRNFEPLETDGPATCLVWFD